MEELGSPDSPVHDDNVPSQPSIHQELLPDRSISFEDITDYEYSSQLQQDRKELLSDSTTLLPDVLSNLADLTTPGVTAALKRMLEENKKKDALITQMKDLMDWDHLSEDVRAFLPEEFLNSLAAWVMNSMQAETVKNCMLEQNRKELEFHKKRDDLVQEHQKELSATKKRQQEAVAECEQKNMPHRRPLVTKKNEEEFQKLLFRQKEDLIALDKKIVTAIDGLLTIQQRKLQEIDIPGMKETVEPTDILQQMIVVDVISKLAGIDVTLSQSS